MACIVCKLADARALVVTELANGKRVVVCATHALVHERLGKRASNETELVRAARERRRPAERRESFPADELGVALIAGFAGERRAGNDRRGR